jgi:hypothetical protein
LKAQQYTIFTKVVNDISQAHLFKLHNKLSIVWVTLQEILKILFIFFKRKFKFKENNFDGAKCSSIDHLYYKNNENIKIIECYYYYDY